jgi:acyl-CoA thioester hydrolase
MDFRYLAPLETGGFMSVAAPLELHREQVHPEWIDYNGHMNVAYYVLAFDHATDVFFDFLGLDEDYRMTSGNSTFAVEAHVTYQREVAEGDELRFTTQLLGFDAKRIHFIHHMYHADQGYLAATAEWLSLHVDLEQRRVAAMPEAIAERLAEVHTAHGALPVPAEVGRVIGNPAPPTG